MPRKVVPTDAAIAELASRQHGVISVSQLGELGIGAEAVRWRVGRGRLHRVHRGVFAVGHMGLSEEATCMAAVLALADPPSPRTSSVLARWGAAVSHRGAAYLWGLLPWAQGPVDVVVARRPGRALRQTIRVHRPRSLNPAEVTSRQGIPVTSPARTIADLGRASRTRQPGAVTAWELRRATRQAEVLGLPLGAEAGTDRTRSDLEAEFLRLCHRFRLPEPEVNVRIGPHLVDFLWRDRSLIVETDGYRYHRGKAAFRQDHRTVLELRRLGYDVLRVSEEQVLDEAAAVAEEIRSTLDP